MFSCARGNAGLLRAFSLSLPRLTPASNLLPSFRTYGQAVQVRKAKKNDFAKAAEAGLVKTYKPITPGIRHLRRPISLHLYEGRPVRALTIAKRKTGGRNAQGRITVRHIGGGHRQRIRTLDFRRDAPGEYDVIRIEYDPGRSSHIALVKSRDPNTKGTQKWAYIIATDGMRAGDVVQSFRSGIPDEFVPGMVFTPDFGKKTSSASATDDEAQALAMGIFRAKTLKPGNVLPLRLIPSGTVIHNIALSPQGPGILVRSAGSFGMVIAHEELGRYTQVRLQSGEVRKVLQDCCASIGKVSNAHWKLRILGKAGRARWLGKRPSVRGVAMNANDHPHGGGRGKSKSNKHPVSIWGWGTKGTRTRKPGPKGPKNSNKMVIRERPRGKEKKGKA